VPAAWVTGDTVYGKDRRLRIWLEEQEQPFGLEVACNEPLWATTERGPSPVRADQLAAQVPPERWERLSAGWGAKGPRLYDWARVPLFRLEWPGFEHGLLVRCSLPDPEDGILRGVRAGGKGAFGIGTGGGQSLGDRGVPGERQELGGAGPV
jgi:hypothetical protein